LNANLPRRYGSQKRVAYARTDLDLVRLGVEQDLDGACHGLVRLADPNVVREQAGLRLTVAAGGGTLELAEALVGIPPVASSHPVRAFFCFPPAKLISGLQ
jgi:hypothetical protein